MREKGRLMSDKTIEWHCMKRKERFQRDRKQVVGSEKK